MNLLSRHRRHLGRVLIGIVGLLLLSAVIPDPLGCWWSCSFADPKADWMTQVQQMTRHAGKFWKNNFGFRASAPKLLRDIRDAAGSSDTHVFYQGRNGRLFWAREGTPEQSSGALLRRAEVEGFVSMIGEMQRILAPRGTKIVVALPPNAQSVDLDELPLWADAVQRPITEYQLALEGLKAEGVATVDLRAVLRETPKPRYLETDTHWNHRSSLNAFNAVMVAAGHRDWQVDLNTTLGPMTKVESGDLLRATRSPPKVQTYDFPVIAKGPTAKLRLDPAFQYPNENPLFRSEVLDFERPGPRILIMGDSFSNQLWPGLFAQSGASVVGWMHASHRVTGSCDFSFKDVERFKPDILIYARVERYFPCRPGDWPIGLPRPDLNAIPAGAAP